MVNGLDLINISLAFFEGASLIFSPCILPVLPIILSGSIEGNKRRPLGVIVGFVLAFTLFTLFSRQLVLSVGLNLNVIRYISFVLLIGFGCIMVSSFLTEKFNIWTSSLANVSLRWTQNIKQTGFMSGVMFGSLVGLIWTPCAGPILAAVIVQTILLSSSFASFFTVLFFGLGAVIPMFIIVFFGRLALKKIIFLQIHAVFIRKTLGVIIILAVIAMIFGNNLYEPSTLKSPKMVTTSGMELKDGLLHSFPAPDFKDVDEWINSPPLSISNLRGKVVLIDFWAYSCINCIRTLPYLKDWYKKYHDQGLVIVGVHSPEFDFERDPKNVENAVVSAAITYPVALDNEFGTWKSYNNLYWPAHYLIDKRGNVVYEHFGEGEYDVTENNIRYLLGIKEPIPNVDETRGYENISPETYLGYKRAARFASKEIILKNEPNIYSYSGRLDVNEWALNGRWIVHSEKIIAAQKDASVKINFAGKKVFAVMGAGEKNIKVTVKLNGVEHGTLDVMTHKLYNLLDLTKGSGGILELTATEANLEIYTFTFGN